MGIFRKNKKKQDGVKKSGKQIKDSKKYPYRVYLKDIYGSSTKKVTHFGVERFIDTATGTVWLRNIDTGFQEREPQDTDEFKIYQISEVKEKIEELELALAKEIKKDDPELNKKNVEFELRQYQNRLRSLELQGRGSYLNNDEDGTPYFTYRRKGNFKFPEFDNVELDTIYTPSESEIKKASELLDMKNQKYSKFQKNLSSITMTLFIVLIIFGGLLVWWSLKLNALSNESSMVLMQERIDETPLFCAEMYGKAGQNFYESSIYVKNITETVVKDLHKPSVVIEGVIPN